MSSNFDLRKMLYKTIERTITNTTNQNTGYEVLSFTDSNYLVNIHVTSEVSSFSIYNVSGISNSFEKLVIYNLDSSVAPAIFKLETKTKNINNTVYNIVLLSFTDSTGESIITNGKIKVEIIYGLLSNLEIKSNITFSENANEIAGITSMDVTSSNASISFYGRSIIVADHFLKNGSNLTYALPTITSSDTLVVRGDLQSQSGDLSLNTKANKVTPTDLSVSEDPNKYFALVEVNSEGIVTHFRKPYLTDSVDYNEFSDAKQNIIEGSIDMETEILIRPKSDGGQPGSLTKVETIVSNPTNQSTIPTEMAVRNALNDKQDSLNNNQLNAVNSGIDFTKVNSYSGHLNNNDIHINSTDRNNWNSKQNPLISDNNIRALNGEKIGTNSLLNSGSFYAPLDNGDLGYILVSNGGGADKEPKWRKVFKVNGSVLIINPLDNNNE